MAHRRMARTMDRDRQGGFTLTELLIAIVIAGVIVGALGNALLVNLRVVDATNTRFSNSNDIQIASNYFSTDVASASTITTSGAPTCVDPTPVGTPHLVLGLSWTDKTRQYGAVAKVVDWVTESSGAVLKRVYCDGAAAPTVLIMSRSLAPAVSPAIQANTCTVTAATCSIVVTETSDDPRLPSATTSYTLTGTRRVYGTPASYPPVPPFLLLAPTGNSLYVNFASSLAIQNPDGSGATGVVDSSSAGAVQFTGGSSLTAGSSLDAVGTCSGATCTRLSSPLSDPYVNLTTPLQSGAGGTTLVCPATTCSYQGPGIYPKLLVLDGDVTLASGIYVLEQGLQMGSCTNFFACLGDSANITAGPGGVMLDLENPYPSAPLPTITQAALLENVILNPVQSGTWAGISVFMPCGPAPRAACPATPTPLGLFAGGNVITNGVVYAPGAQLTSEVTGLLSFFFGTPYSQTESLIANSVTYPNPLASFRSSGSTGPSPTEGGSPRRPPPRCSTAGWPRSTPGPATRSSPATPPALARRTRPTGTSAGCSSCSSRCSSP